MKPCLCDLITSAGDMAPDMWVCATHGKTGRAALIIALEELNITWDQAWEEYQKLEDTEDFHNILRMTFSSIT